MSVAKFKTKTLLWVITRNTGNAVKQSNLIGIKENKDYGRLGGCVSDELSKRKLNDHNSYFHHFNSNIFLGLFDWRKNETSKG